MAAIRLLLQWFKMRTVVVVHEALLSNTPSNLKNKLVSRSDITDCRTWQNAMLQLPLLQLEAGKKRFSYFGPQIYNSLSLPALSLQSFKEEVKAVIVLIV